MISYTSEIISTVVVPTIQPVKPWFCSFCPIAEITALLSSHMPLGSSWTWLSPLVNVAHFSHL